MQERGVNVSAGQIHNGRMDEMIRKLYEKMQAEREYDDPIEQKLREELEKLLGDRTEAAKNEALHCTDEEETAAEKTEAEKTEAEKTAAAYPNRLSEIDRLYAAAEIGEEAGFVCGFRYGFRLCMECLQN